MEKPVAPKVGKDDYVWHFSLASAGENHQVVCTRGKQYPNEPDIKWHRFVFGGPLTVGVRFTLPGDIQVGYSKVQSSRATWLEIFVGQFRHIGQRFPKGTVVTFGGYSFSQGSKGILVHRLSTQ
jgi:hypothetical protein